MRRTHLWTVWSLLVMPILVVRMSVAQLPCPPMPEVIDKVTHDVHSDVEARVGTLGKLKAGEVGVKTDVVAKNLFDKYPNTDRIMVIQTMAATYCAMIRDSTTIKDTEKLRLWSEFSDRVFKFANPTYNPTPPRPPKPKASPPPLDKSKQAAPETGKTEAPHTDKQDQVHAQDSAPQHWFTESTTSPPGRIEFKASGISIPLTLVTGNHFGDDLPVKVAPYYISTEYIPKQLLREHAMNYAVRIAPPPASEDKDPICEIYFSDAKDMADKLGFYLPTVQQWINAYEGKFIDPQGKVELVYAKDEKGEYLADARTDEGGNTYYSNRVSVHSLYGKAEGCLRIAISLAQLRQLGFPKAALSPAPPVSSPSKEPPLWSWGGIWEASFEQDKGDPAKEFLRYWKVSVLPRSTPVRLDEVWKGQITFKETRALAHSSCSLYYDVRFTPEKDGDELDYSGQLARRNGECASAAEELIKGSLTKTVPFEATMQSNSANLIPKRPLHSQGHW